MDGSYRLMSTHPVVVKQGKDYLKIPAKVRKGSSGKPFGRSKFDIFQFCKLMKLTFSI